jgi:AraC-like DNA-binding protein
MNDPTKNERLQRINQMLLEMAGGNFFYRLERSGENDTIEALVVILNMLAEEIQESFLHQGYVNSKGTTKPIVQLFFMLNANGIIQMINQKTCTVLSTLYNDIIEKPFDSFLTEASKTKWRKTWKALQQKDFYDTSLELTFKSHQKLLIPNACYITTFKGKSFGERKTLITAIHYSNKQSELERDLKEHIVHFIDKQESVFKGIKPKKPKLRLSYEDIRKIRKGHDIIIHNLEKELPSLKDFAHQLGTNEFKLKYGFRELYGTSVYRFLIQERLRKTKMLIQYSDLPLKSIAHKTGFKSIPHFSRTFKKRYGYSPSMLRKKTMNEER